MTSRKVASLEKVCTELLERAKTKNLRVKGPVRLPTKVLKVSLIFWFSHWVGVKLYGVVCNGTG